MHKVFQGFSRFGIRAILAEYGHTPRVEGVPQSDRSQTGIGRQDGIMILRLLSDLVLIEPLGEHAPDDFRARR
ncbi:hypothetical protein CLV74_1376 [Donghicola tyrosinivorans]|uniref:Uncharacterized protein n=1 Tax=Donghicola tyrosinivorans TaxID=1652492 RepID=A0A2T0W8B2_9RHOB|nr:hypothetical protein CLV74_1376 [Donghicola tyrosinivorans]